MAAKSGWFPWARPLVFMLIVLALPWLAYEELYVPKRVENAKHRAFETVAAVTGELGERLRALDQVAASASKMWGDRVQYLHALLEVPPTVEPLSKEAAVPKRLEASTDSRGGLLLRVRPTSPATPPVTASTTRVSPGAKSKPQAPPAPAQTPERPGALITVALGFERFLPWGVIQDAFDGLAVLDRKTGKVLIGDPRAPGLVIGEVVRFRREKKAVTLEQVLSDAADAQTVNGEKGSQGGAAGGLEGAAAAALSVSSRRGLLSDVRAALADREYVAFAQPLRVPVGSIDDGEPGSLDLVVCALVQEERLTQRAVALSARQLTGAIFVVALAILAIPFLKLRFIGRRERMHTYDVWLLGGSGLIGAALIVLFILYGGAVDLFRQRFDAGLLAFSNEIEAKTSQEATAAVTELRAAQRLIPSGIGLLLGVDSGSALAGTDEFTSYAPFEAMVYMNLEGLQRQKWMLRTIPTPMIRESAASYFRDALTLRVEERPERDVGLFAFESRVAPTSGLELGIFALPASKTAVGAEVPLAERSGVVAIATEFYSLRQPLVPPPFGFVVLDRDRRVTFQSSEGAYRGQRLLEAFEGGPELARSAVAEGTAEGRFAYRDSVVSVRARNLPALGSMAITYYDEAVAESLAGLVFGTTAIGAALIVASILVGAWLVRRVLGERALDWAWPSPQRLHVHIVGIAECVCVSAAWPLLWTWLPGSLLFALFLLAPVVAMAFAGVPQAEYLAARLFGRLGLERRLETWSVSAPVYPGLFVVFVLSALMAFVCVPIAIVFQDAFALHSLAYENLSKATFDEAAAAQDQVLERAVAETSPGKSETLTLNQAAILLLEDPRCTVTDRICATKENRSHYLEQRRTFGRYATRADLDGSDAGPTSVMTRFVSTRLALEVAPLGRRASELVPALEQLLEHPEQGNRAAFVWTSLGRDGALGIAGLLLVVVGLVVSSSRHVLGLDLVGDGVWPRDDEFKSPASPARRWLLLRPDSAKVSTLRESRDPTPWDLLSPALTLETFKPTDPGKDKTLLIDHVEFRLGDEKWRRALCSLAAAEFKGDLVLVSEIDPAYFVAQRLREAVTARLPAAGDDRSALVDTQQEIEALEDELRQWAMALRGFEKIRFAAAKPFRQETLFVSLADKIRAECSHSDELAEVRDRLLEYAQNHPLRWADAVHFIQDAAEPYYRSLWEMCSRAEKLVMIQLAEEGVVNPKSVDLLRRLARRRLVTVDPRYRLMNDSFRAFVLTAEPRERVAEWERVNSSETWSRIGTPLYALGIMLVSIVLLTEQAELTSVLGVTAAAASTVGALRGVIVGARAATGASTT